MSDTNSTELAPASNAGPDTAVESIDPVRHALQQLRITWCNVPYNSDPAERLMLASIGETDLKPDALFGVEIGIEACLIRTVTVTDKVTGEVLEKPRTVFLLDGGETVSFISIGVLESLSVLASRRPKGLWNPPLRVKLRQITLSNGHRKYVLQPVYPAIATPAKKGGANGK